MTLNIFQGYTAAAPRVPMAELRRDLDRAYSTLGPEGAEMSAETEAIHGVDISDLIKAVDENDAILAEAKADYDLVSRISSEPGFDYLAGYTHLSQIRETLGITLFSQDIILRQECDLVAAELVRRIAGLEQEQIVLARRVLARRAFMSGCPWITLAEKEVLSPFAERAARVLAEAAA